jgi:hypothetical protein
VAEYLANLDVSYFWLKLDEIELNKPVGNIKINSVVSLSLEVQYSI